jgi:hypothetical protein
MGKHDDRGGLDAEEVNALASLMEAVEAGRDEEARAIARTSKAKSAIAKARAMQEVAS